MHIIEAISRTYTLAGGLPRASDAPRDPAAQRRTGRPGRSPAAVLRRLARGIARTAGDARTAYRRRQAIRELSALSDRTLKDIGIARGEIPAVISALDEATFGHGRRPASENRRARITAGAPLAAANDNAPGLVPCAGRGCA